jgi:F-type H+-transporting ATPase subunit delta
MITSTIEKHAEALFELAQEEKAVADYEAALQSVLLSLRKEPSLAGCLESYAVPKEENYRLIDEVYGKIPLKSLTSFLKVIVDHHLMDHFEDVELAYRHLANLELGIKEGLVYSASPLSKEELALLTETLEEKLQAKVALESRTEPSLLGGVKVAIDGKVYDGTLLSKVEALRTRLLAQGGEEK